MTIDKYVTLMGPSIEISRDPLTNWRRKVLFRKIDDIEGARAADIIFKVFYCEDDKVTLEGKEYDVVKIVNRVSVYTIPLRIDNMTPVDKNTGLYKTGLDGKYIKPVYLQDENGEDTEPMVDENGDCIWPNENVQGEFNFIMQWIAEGKNVKDLIVNGVARASYLGRFNIPE